MKHFFKYIPVLMVAVSFSCKHLVPVETKDDNVIADSIVQRVEVATVAMDDLAETIKLNGKVAPDDKKQARVYALVSGKIQSISAELGDYVKKGQSLATLQSTEVAGVTNDLSLAQSNADIT
jgi:membrane fusion protein, heavy metal efflux system